jgi:hypothetical protein
MMESIYELYPFEIPDFSVEAKPSDEKICPGLHRFCPHYIRQVCDVKYSECVLLNSLKTSETILRMERENLIKNPTPKNLGLVAQINDVLRDKNPDMNVDPAAILRNKRKGRLVATLFFLAIVAAAVLIYIG